MELQEIQKKYPGEWVLIEFDDLDSHLEPKSGHVLFHSPNREEAYRALTTTVGKNVAIEYTGQEPDDLTVMFFFS